jgi:type IV pilus assembly protein PilA
VAGSKPLHRSPIAGVTGDSEWLLANSLHRERFYTKDLAHDSAAIRWRTAMSRLLNKSKKGFTLIELMIVVAIIGILAAIAIPNFLRFQLKSKTSEGKVNLAAIRTAEESYLAEYGQYVPAVATPATAGTPQKMVFDDGTPGVVEFDTLGWGPEGDVFFQYGVVVDGTNVLAYTADATADIDGDGVVQVWGYRHIDPAGNSLGGAGANGCAQVDVGTTTDVENTVGPCLIPVGASGQSVF